MPQSGTLYEYDTTSEGGNEYKVRHGTQESGTATIENLSPGDQFVFDGKIYTYEGGADSGSTQVGFFATTKNGATHFFSFTAQTSNDTYTLNTGQSSTICFMAGTRIATPAGTTPIEELSTGDLVVTSDGSTLPILWIGRQTIVKTFADRFRTLPVRITAGALADGIPSTDLLVSPSHALLIDGILVEPGALVNGTTVRREENVPDRFVYYHIELATHDLVLAEGVPAETFVDNISREHFDNWADRQVADEGELATGEMDLPRVKSVRQLPASIRARLASRAAALIPQDVVAAA